MTRALQILSLWILLAVVSSVVVPSIGKRYEGKWFPVTITHKFTLGEVSVIEFTKVRDECAPLYMLYSDGVTWSRLDFKDAAKAWARPEGAHVVELRGFPMNTETIAVRHDCHWLWETTTIMWTKP